MLREDIFAPFCPHLISLASLMCGTHLLGSSSTSGQTAALPHRHIPASAPRTSHCAAAGLHAAALPALPAAAPSPVLPVVHGCAPCRARTADHGCPGRSSHLTGTHAHSHRSSARCSPYPRAVCGATRPCTRTQAGPHRWAMRNSPRLRPHGLAPPVTAAPVVLTIGW
jgi:hypothetical protein